MIEWQAFIKLIRDLGLPALLAISGFGFLQLIEIKENLAAIATVEPRLTRVENWQDQMQAEFISNPRIGANDAGQIEDRFSQVVESRFNQVTVQFKIIGNRLDRIEDRIEKISDDQRQLSNPRPAP